MSSSSSSSNSFIQQFVPVWKNFGYDNQATQRSVISLDLNNLDLFFKDTTIFTDIIHSGYYGESTLACGNASLAIATYDNEEYVYIGTGGVDGNSYVSNLNAIKIKLNNTEPIYSVLQTTLLAGVNGGNKIRASIVTSSSGQVYILAYCPYKGGSNPEVFRITPPPTGFTNGILEPFTHSSFTYSGDFGPEYAGRSRIIDIDGYCYSAGNHLTQFNPDQINDIYISRSIISTDANAYYGTFIVADSRAIAGSHNMYIAYEMTYRLFRSQDVTDYVPIKGNSFRDGNTAAYWGGYCRGLVFKDSPNELDRRLYAVVYYVATNSYGLVSYNKDYNPIASIRQTSFPTFSGPALGSNGTIYYRAGTTLYAIKDSGLYSSSETVSNGSLSIKYTYSGLPNDSNVNGLRHTATPIIDGSGKIIVCSNALGVDNVHIFTDTGTELRLDKSFYVDGRIHTTPSIGSTGILYILADTKSLYAYGSAIIPILSSSSSSYDLPTKIISMASINQGHNDIIPFSWIAENGTNAIVSNSQIDFTIEASDSSYMNYSAVIDRDNVAVTSTLLANTAPTIYTPNEIDTKYVHDRHFYIDVIAKDVSGIKSTRVHVEPNVYQSKDLKESYTFKIPKFTWSN